MIDNESISLIDDVLADVASEDQRRVFVGRVMADEAFALEVIRHGILLGNLRDEFALNPQTVSRQRRPEAIKSSRWRGLPVYSALAAMLAIAAIGWFAFQPEPHIPPTEPATPAASVAMLTNTENAVFATETPHLGSTLQAGPIQLVSGQAQIMFDSTAVVDLTGPCDFEMTGPNRGRLISGTLEAYVPDRARGFTVQTPSGLQVVDLGTRFDLEVGPADINLVRVIEGEVEVRYPAAENAPKLRRLSAGEGVIACGGRFETMAPLVTPATDPFADDVVMTSLADGVSWSAGTLSLHPNALYTSGGVTTRRPIELSTSGGAGFACAFDFECADSFGAGGGDWIKFYLGAEPGRSDELATRGITGSQQLVIVFDSYLNAETNDPSAAFVDVITTQGVVAKVDLSGAPLHLPDLSGSGPHRVRLIWLADRLSISLDGREIVHELPIRLTRADGSPLSSLWLGFGAHTGSSRELHLIRNCWFAAIPSNLHPNSLRTEIHHDTETK